MAIIEDDASVNGALARFLRGAGFEPTLPRDEMRPSFGCVLVDVLSAESKLRAQRPRACGLDYATSPGDSGSPDIGGTRGDEQCRGAKAQFHSQALPLDGCRAANRGAAVNANRCAIAAA